MNTQWIDFFQRALSVAFGVIGTWLALKSFYEKKQQETLDRYASGREKTYAAERDFQHLRNNQEQMKEALKLLDDEQSETRADLRELKGMLFAMFGKQGETFSGIFANRDKKE